MGDDLLHGVIDWGVDASGFGVIRGDDGRNYVIRDIDTDRRRLKKGTRVVFQGRVDARGSGKAAAYNVKSEATLDMSSGAPISQGFDEIFGTSKRPSARSTRKAMRNPQSPATKQSKVSLSEGTQVWHPDYGEGSVTSVQETTAKVIFEQKPRLVKRSECIIAPDRSPELNSFIQGMKSEVFQKLTSEGVNDPRRVYRYDPPGYPEQPPQPLAIDPVVANLFEDVEGITRFYSHQRETREHLLAGEHVVICTPTASGKTEAYNPTILEELLSNPESRALYIFPLIALGVDQRVRLQSLNRELPPEQQLILAIYNREVDSDEKKRVLRADNQILITTPESLHYVFLPKPYPNWQRFFRNLRYIVLDEAHVYKGVLGINMANTVRRLLSRCRREGNPWGPQIVVSSATVRRPLALAQQLTGLQQSDFAVVDETGAPKPPQHYLVTRSDIHNLTGTCEKLMTMSTTDSRTKERRPLRTIVFLPSIRRVKAAADNLQDALKKHNLSHLVPYVGTYYSENNDKGEIFADLRAGKIRCLFTTNALMVGIDIGTLDVSIVEGFPRRIMNARQMFGRAGRSAEGASIFITRPYDPFDQFYFQRPDLLFKGRTEEVIANPENPLLLEAHLKCAAQVIEGQHNNCEGPLAPANLSLFGPKGNELVEKLLAEDEFEITDDGYELRSKTDPHGIGPLKHFRSLWQEEYVLENASGEILERKRKDNAYRDAHPGALVWHGGDLYEVTDFDSENWTIRCELTPDRNIRTRGAQELDIDTESDDVSSKLFGNLVIPLHLGEAVVETNVSSYFRYRREPNMRCQRPSCRYSTRKAATRKCPLCGSPMQLHVEEEIIEEVTLDESLDTELSTIAMWLDVSILRARFREEVSSNPRSNKGRDNTEDHKKGTNSDFKQAVHSLLHALIHAIPEHLRCDTEEIGGLYRQLKEGKQHLIYIYDNFPGGLGLVDEVFDDPRPVLETALEIVERCTCMDDSGCPVCLNYYGCRVFNQDLSKLGARYLLRRILGKPTEEVLADVQNSANDT